MTLWVLFIASLSLIHLSATVRSVYISLSVLIVSILTLCQHLYECLSYVWGSQEEHQEIYINRDEANFKTTATKNLHAALVRLRDPFFERILWVDAICINQQDKEERTQQVAAMARIYGLAKRVVVWLGEEAGNSALAFQELRNLAQESQPADAFSRLSTQERNKYSIKKASIETSSAVAEQAILRLLSRTYFRRMWVCANVERATPF